MSLEEVRTYINSIRRDFAGKELSKKSVDKNPFKQYSVWFEEAVNCQLLDPYAAVLSTVDALGRVSSRVVYIRDISEKGFVFYTNYLSKKGQDLAKNKSGAFNVHWGELERQIRMEGEVVPVSASDSDKYFASRPRESQIGAWASEQSTSLENREQLENKIIELTTKFEGNPIPRPSHWGGYILIPDRVEFWQGRPGRLHDRILYSLNAGKWEIGRLSP